MTEFMQAACLIDYHQIQYKKIDMPVPNDQEIVVRVTKTGICGSDLSTYHGNHPYKTAPTVLGHEFSGIISAIGTHIKNFKVGDKVCCAAYANCTSCHYCLNNQHHLCHNKSAFSWQGWDGSFAQYVITKPQKTYHLPDAVDCAHGALVEPLSIGFHALALTKIKAQHLIIIGAGCIGLSTSLCAQKMAAGKITVVDVLANKKTLAHACGADHFITSTNHLSDQADVTIIAASYAHAIDDAIRTTKPGGTVIIIAYFKTSMTFDANQAVRKEITIMGSALSEDKDCETIISWIAEKSLNPSPLITHQLPLHKLDEALSLMSDPEQCSGKILLSPEKPKQVKL